MNCHFSKLAVIAGMFSYFTVGTALAAGCPCAGGDVMSNLQITQDLGNKTVCASYASDKWQEWHKNDGSIFEMGNTPGGEGVGGWSVSADPSAKIIYSYTGDPQPYSYTVCKEGSNTYHFCGATNVTGAWTTSGGSACGF